jgi:predicted nucleic acid-binding Zn ribbon protein
MNSGSQHNPVTLKNVFERMISGFGWDELVIQERIPEIWKEVVGEKIAAKAKTIRFDKGILYIRIIPSTWRTELMLRRETIKDEINKIFGSKIVGEIVIK